MTPSRNKTTPERRKALEQKLAKVQRDLRLALKAEKEQDRRDDTRRKVIAGALALEHLATNPGSEFGKIMFRLLDQYTRPDDRHLFDFLPVREATTANTKLEAAE